ncbi:hypothetical protein PYW08_012293 [Mythimna loreyi]|uniref:Uncharacterized protein n=1 Tax=Mythimna loreyi TaxID=667449 RepID=A0ACC2Q0M0_9NEOP|nr:hypothetical protein PYW08_012293 [Mythimna loreyi]
MYSILPLIVTLGVSVHWVATQKAMNWEKRDRWPKDEPWDGPGRFTREDEVTRFQFRHLINMTEMICKDATNKVRQADLIQTAYKHTIGYELGMLCCGIFEKFRHMIRVYRYYSNPVMFKDHKHDIHEIMNAYSVMQSDYSELIAEIVLYYEVLEDHRRMQAAKVFRARVYAKKHRMSVAAVLDLMDKGIDIENLDKTKVRRSMLIDLPKDDEELEIMEIMEEIERTGNASQVLSKIEKELKLNITEQKQGLKTPEIKDQGLQFDKEEPKKYKKNLFAQNGSKEEAEYKKKLRYIMWAEKWDGYNPDSEGVHIDTTIARLGFNESDFLLKELRGDV